MEGSFINTGNGDGTVPAFSALSLQLTLLEYIVEYMLSSLAYPEGRLAILSKPCSYTH